MTGIDQQLRDALDGIETLVTRYVVFPSEHEQVAVALWVAHAHNVERSEVSPILAITSAEMRSGKTRVLDCLELLVPNPFRVVTPSEAVVYTVLAQRPRRTMLLDEADAIFGPRTAERYEGLRAILNAGNRQGTPVLRVKLEGRRREVDEFDVFGPKAIAGIGKLPDTVADRSIPIRLKRRAPGEEVGRFRRRVATAEAEAVPAVPLVPVPQTDPEIPDELNDRAADSWEPLLVIADLAGGPWPLRARLAALALSADDDRDLSTGMRLLSDIRDIFTDKQVQHLATAELLTALHDLEAAPWSEWYGKPITAAGLAKLLAPYGLAPDQRRVDGEKVRGYFRATFEDAWQRYLPPPGTEDVELGPIRGSSGAQEPISEPTALPVWEAGTAGTNGTTPHRESVADRFLRIIGEDQ